jgi:hypothetical protein
MSEKKGATCKANEEVKIDKWRQFPQKQEY